MDRVEFVRSLFRYNRQVLENFRRRLSRKPWRTINANRGSGHLSLVGTFVHVLNVHDIWWNYVIPGKMADLARAGKRRDFDSWGEVTAYWNRVWTGVEARMADLTEAELDRRTKAPWMPGPYTVWDAAFQTSLEQAHHIGEMIALFWQKDEEPPEMMWIPTQTRLRRTGRGSH
jgi:uncharacterized damage-inducible protein DinB